ncbi:15382_t:CDS:1, partial [Acaulospora morrowiae]
MSFRLPHAQSILTLVYNSKSKNSNTALSILYEALRRQPGVFKLDILDCKKQPLTKDQLRNITDYLGAENDLKSVLRNDESEAVETASNVDELENVIKKQPDRMQRPILVDWNKGKAIIARPPEK